MHPVELLFLDGEITFVVSQYENNTCCIQHIYVLFLAISCPSGLVYQQCGPVCPQACDTDEDTECSNGCIEGCFCPNGKALYKGMCVNAADCEGKAIIACLNYFKIWYFLVLRNLFKLTY